MDRILVWDWPVRLGHWLLVGAFALAWITSESEALRLIHAASGGVLVGAILFRLLWGMMGTRHARFISFVRGPAAVWNYLKDLACGRPPHSVGHNPAGGWAILALLALGLVTSATGWLTYNDLGGELAEELHEGAVNAMLAVVCVHLAGVIIGSLAHRENLVRAMLTGMKRGMSGEAIASARPLAAVALRAAPSRCCGMATSCSIRQHTGSCWRASRSNSPRANSRCCKSCSRMPDG